MLLCRSSNEGGPHWNAPPTNAEAKRLSCFRLLGRRIRFLIKMCQCFCHSAFVQSAIDLRYQSHQFLGILLLGRELVKFR
jgi:hypothetical protein